MGTRRCAPGSTSKNGKTYRLYQRSTRDKHGKEACSARPLPARALEELVAERITAATAASKLAVELGKPDGRARELVEANLRVKPAASSPPSSSSPRPSATSR